MAHRSRTHIGSTLPDSADQRISRRALLGGAAAAAAALPLARTTSAAPVAADWKVTNDRINQSVCAWCFKPMPLEKLAAASAAMGIKSIELVPPEQWDVLRKHGLVCAITSSHGFVKGLNDKANHPECLEKLTKAIDATSAAGFPNVITFSGFRNGISDEDGIANMVAGLKKIVGHAEKKNVTLCLEVLNSRVDVEMKGHPGYQCDSVEWAAEVCRKVGSPRAKILFDIYHVQIMQGDVITRIRQYHDLVGHYHTAGVPGRNELDDNQELNYPPIMREIVKTGYNGYVGQEFIPTTDDPIGSLRQAVKLCDM